MEIGVPLPLRSGAGRGGEALRNAPLAGAAGAGLLEAELDGMKAGGIELLPRTAAVHNGKFRAAIGRLF